VHWQVKKQLFLLIMLYKFVGKRMIKPLNKIEIKNVMVSINIFKIFIEIMAIIFNIDLYVT